MSHSSKASEQHHFWPVAVIVFFVISGFCIHFLFEEANHFSSVTLCDAAQHKTRTDKRSASFSVALASAEITHQNLQTMLDNDTVFVSERSVKGDNGG